MLSYQEFQIREEALAYILFKIEVTFDVFQRTYQHILSNKDQKTQYEYSLVRKVQLRNQLAEEKEDKEMFKDQILSRE